MTTTDEIDAAAQAICNQHPLFIERQHEKRALDWSELTDADRKIFTCAAQAALAAADAVRAKQEPVGCTLCAHGNDLPEGEYCRACGFGIEKLTGLARGIALARGINSPPKIPLRFSTDALREALVEAKKWIAHLGASSRFIGVQSEGILARIDAALAPADMRDGWRTIDSAPRDGTHLIGWEKSWYCPAPVFWNTDSGSWRSWPGARSDTNPIYWPTHWMPLPPAPDGGER